MAEEPRPVVREREVTEEERYPVPPPPEPTRTSGLAIASLATGIAAWIIIPLFGAIAAVITGYFAQEEIRQSGGRVTGAPLATAGIVLGGVQLGLILIASILFAALVTQVVGAGGFILRPPF